MSDVTPWLALGAGLLSFFAPCVLPVVPGYLAFVTGGPDAAAGQRIARTIAFVSGFGVAFVALGVLIGAVGSTPAFQSAETWAQRVGGALIIAFGLVMVGLVRIPWLDRDVRYHGRAPQRFGPTVGAGFLGAAFAVGWSPCVGPILASILVLAGVGGSATSGALLLSLYALGLAIPFLVLGIGAERGVRVIRRMGRATRAIELVGGCILILLGVFVFTGAVGRVLSYVV